MVPKQHSSGGKNRLGNISKQGDRYLRGLFVAGALAVIRYAKIHGTKHRPWLTALLHRPSLLREESPCQSGAVHTWHDNGQRCSDAQRHSDFVRHAVKSEDLVENRHNDCTTADTKQARQHAGARASRSERGSQPSGLAKSKISHRSGPGLRQMDMAAILNSSRSRARSTARVEGRRDLPSAERYCAVHGRWVPPRLGGSSAA